MTEEKRRVTIWFLCGVILSVYGITIVGSGIYNVFNPPEVFGAALHLDLWWGFLLVGVGAFLIFHQRPGQSGNAGENKG